MGLNPWQADLRRQHDGVDGGAMFQLPVLEQWGFVDMKHYKQVLLQELQNDGWELLERNDDCEGWLEEAWKIRSIKQHWGYEVFILFLVDPQYDGPDKHRAVWSVAARTELPTQRPLDKGIATMDLQRGKFNERLRALVDAIGRHRTVVGLEGGSNMRSHDEPGE